MLGRRVKILLCTLLIMTMFIITLVIGCNAIINHATVGLTYSSLKQLPYNKVGVLLGTSRYTSTGGYNDYYRIRIQAAYQLYQAGKIDYILISGDNATTAYNEPNTIRNDLLELGIPAERLYRDYAGFRTLDSIIRAHDVFQLDKFTIISQAPHNQRALYIAKENQIDAIAFNASSGALYNLNNQIRELLARVLAVIEVNILTTQPKFLGPPINIGATPPT